MAVVREHTKLPIHVSTQANVLNKFTAMEYVKLGASRIVLARECSIDEIRDIVKHVGDKCEIEVFVHGAMCLAYSGRCLLSNYLTPAGEKPRESNRGECCQPCRWKYALLEEKRPGQYMEIEQDGRGSYILNSKDLCLAGHLDELISAGVTSIKIEGRMKSEYYVGATVNAYRRLLDKKMAPRDAVLEVQKTAHREFTTGFVFGDTMREFYKQTQPVANYEFIATVALNSNGDATARVILRGAFNVGDELEILSPGENFNKTFKISKIFDAGGAEITRANRPLEIYKIDCPFELKVGDMLRKRV
jgi:putative protease